VSVLSGVGLAAAGAAGGEVLLPSDVPVPGSASSPPQPWKANKLATKIAVTCFFMDPSFAAWTSSSPRSTPAADVPRNPIRSGFVIRARGDDWDPLDQDRS
jgi:hypothetical protein